MPLIKTDKMQAINIHRSSIMNWRRSSSTGQGMFILEGENWD